MKKTPLNRVIAKLLPLILFAFTLSPGALLAKTKTSAPTMTNHLASTQELSGIYFGIRHGESVPVLEKRVCSSMKNGVDPANGLTPKGREEVQQSTLVWIKENKKLIAKYLQRNDLVILSSPFSRTRQTAEIVADLIQEKFKNKLPKSLKAPGSLKQNIIIENNLRERFFGNFEGQYHSDDIYKKVWAQDVKDPANTKGNVESPNAVQDRTTGLIVNLEKESQASNGGKMFLLVAHGDTLKIVQTGFQKLSASTHADPNIIPKFKTSEIRMLKLSGGANSTATK
jgi:broad specificity phosphatase PhoE